MARPSLAMAFSGLSYTEQAGPCGQVCATKSPAPAHIARTGLIHSADGVDKAKSVVDPGGLQQHNPGDSRAAVMALCFKHHRKQVF